MKENHYAIVFSLPMYEEVTEEGINQLAKFFKKEGLDFLKKASIKFETLFYAMTYMADEDSFNEHADELEEKLEVVFDRTVLKRFKMSWSLVAWNITAKKPVGLLALTRLRVYDKTSPSESRAYHVSEKSLQTLEVF